uniref:Anoctamin-8-like n=1 Tax=Saccoglossus kowalevskii TaxID=10224 RepID=A0ABM0LX00_SACKO|nr:PREDICTED: anoctamin-8-like [Saccoglossus kowalevskii]
MENIVFAKLFGKKFAKASKFVVANKLWQSTVPTKDCDVLMTFPEKTDDDTLMWVLARLRSRTPQIGVHVRHHSNTGVYGFYLTATFENLMKGAEDLGFRKKVKEEFGGGLKDFSCDEEIIYEGIDNQADFFSSQERQEIVLFMLNNLRAEEGDKLAKLKFVEGQPIGFFGVFCLVWAGIIEILHMICKLHNEVIELRSSEQCSVFSAL